MPRQESLTERAIDKVKPQPAPPPKPKPPSVPKKEWEDSVDRKHVAPGLTVRDIGLSVYGETRSLKDRPGSNESIEAARQKLAHAMINDAELSHHTGKARNIVHPPIEPTKDVLQNRAEQAALDSSIKAAREAYLSGHDPTNGSIYFLLAKTASRANKVYSDKNKKGVDISTQSGPYDNTYPQGDTKSRTVWVNTYLPDENDKKIRKHR